MRLGLYEIGDIVRHKVFGKGKVIKITEREDSAYRLKCNDLSPIITVEFETPMLTEAEKNFWFVHGPIAIREFTEDSLEKFSLMDEFDYQGA